MNPPMNGGAATRLPCVKQQWIRGMLREACVYGIGISRLDHNMLPARGPLNGDCEHHAALPCALPA